MQAQDNSAEDLRILFLSALDEKARGTSSKGYQMVLDRVRMLKHATRPGNGSAPGVYQGLAAFTVLLQGLTQCVSAIHERKHEALVKEVLDIQLWRVHQMVRGAILEFITHVVVANGALVQTCLQTLVYSLVPPPGPPSPDRNPGEARAPLPEEAAIQDEVVAALEKVLHLVPTAGARVLPLLLRNVPHRLRPRDVQCLYLRALFALAEGPSGAPIREGVLAGVLEHLITIDVEIRWEDIVDVVTEEAKEEEGGLPEEEEPDIFELEGMSELDLANGGHLERDKEGGCGGEEGLCGRGGWEGGGRIGKRREEKKDPGVPEGAAKPAVNETADKLDSMMEQTLQHLQRRVAGGQLAPAWDTLAAAFERTVLQTHRSKFVQFVLFYMCRQAPEPCCRSFLSLLLARLTDPQQPPITRSACAAYIASFLARAAYIPEALVVEQLQRLAEWCIKYTRDEDRRGGLPPIPSSTALHSLSGDAAVRHAAFFAACQAVLYALCYHMEPLLRYHRSGSQQAQHAAQQAQQAAAGATLPGANTTLAVGGHGAGHGATPPVPTGGPPAGTGGGLPPLPPGAGAGSVGNAGHGARSASPGVGMGSHHHHHHQAQREACAAAVHALVSTAMPRLVAHSLDPLSSCAKSVVMEFARQARSLGLAEVSKAIKDWERRQADPTTSSHRPRPLEMFFPFDPYLLRRSSALLDLGATYVVWRRGHPSGAVRADLASSDSEEEEEESDADSDMSEDKGEEGESDEESSGLGTSSSSSEDESENESDDDDLRRTRFGSMPDSIPSSGGSGRGRRSHHRGRRPHLPGALKASLAHGSMGAGSPTLGFVLPGAVGSYSTDGMASPYGTSPMLYGTSCGGGLAPMSCTPHQ